MQNRKTDKTIGKRKTDKNFRKSAVTFTIFNIFRRNKMQQKRFPWVNDHRTGICVLRSLSVQYSQKTSKNDTNTFHDFCMYFENIRPKVSESHLFLCGGH